MALPCLRTYFPSNKKLFGFIPIQPFGLIVGIGLILGYHLSRRRAQKTGLDPDLCADGIVWTVASGFIVGHLVSVIFYFPHKIAQDPLVLLKVWDGLSSFGGFIGGIVGAIWFFRRNGVSPLKYVDAIIFGTVPGWVLGRLGCAIVHDHPGKATDFVLGVACYNAQLNAPIVHDLGLYEMLYLLFVTAVLYGAKNWRPFHGFHPALVMSLYAPARFAMDYLRVEDKTYFGLTPGQYLSGAMFGLAFALGYYGWTLKKKGDFPGASVEIAPTPYSPPRATKSPTKKHKKSKR